MKGLTFCRQQSSAPCSSGVLEEYLLTSECQWRRLGRLTAGRELSERQSLDLPGGVLVSSSTRNKTGLPYHIYIYYTYVRGSCSVKFTRNRSNVNIFLECFFFSRGAMGGLTRTVPDRIHDFVVFRNLLGSQGRVFKRRFPHPTVPYCEVPKIFTPVRPHK